MKKSTSIFLGVFVGLILGCGGNAVLSTVSTSTAGGQQAIVFQHPILNGGAMLPAPKSANSTQAALSTGFVPAAEAQTTTSTPDVVMSFEGQCATLTNWDQLSPSGQNAQVNVIGGLGMPFGQYIGRCQQTQIPFPDQASGIPSPGNPDQGALVVGSGTLSSFHIYDNGGGNATLQIYDNGVYLGSPCTLTAGQKEGTCDPTAAYPVNDGDVIQAGILAPTQADCGTACRGTGPGIQNVQVFFGKS